MMRILKSCVMATAAMALVLNLSGCATSATADNMTVRAATATDMRQRTPEMLRDNVAIKDVTGGRATNPMWMSNISSVGLNAALEQSLHSVGMLAPGRQAGKFQLVAHLDKVDQPFAGFDMTVTTTVIYQLIDRASGRTVWEKTISSPYTAKMGDAIIGTERLRLANEGSVRENITRLVSDLQALKAESITVK